MQYRKDNNDRKIEQKQLRFKVKNWKEKQINSEFRKQMNELNYSENNFKYGCEEEI